MGNLKKALDFFVKLVYNTQCCAGVMELADVVDSKSTGSDTVPVRVRPPAPFYAVSAFEKVETAFLLFVLQKAVCVRGNCILGTFMW